MALVVLTALVALVILGFLFSKTPLRTLRYFFLGPIQNIYYFGNMLNSAIPLIFGGLGASIAMRSNKLNLGGEGQVYIGGFVSVIAGLALAPLGIAGVALALLAGAIAAGLVSGVSGFLKTKWDTSELTTSFLLSNALLLIIDYLITGPFLDSETSLQSTAKIAQWLRLPKILPPSSLSAALFFAVAAIILVYFFLYRTLMGYEMRISGLDETFARYGGVNTAKSGVLAMFLSGALYGIGGGVAIYGTYYAAIKGFSAGMGWNGLAVALIARSRPQAIIPAAIFFAWIESGAYLAMQFSDVTIELASITQSVVFFMASSTVLRAIFAPRSK
jgi:simple sugar transport system permease protein